MKLLEGPVKYYLMLAVLFIILIFVLPANSSAMHDYHLSAGQYHLLLFIVQLPLVVTWFITIFGYEQLHKYTNLIKGSKEEPAYRSLTKGSKWLAFGLIIPSFVSSLLSAFVNDHPVMKTFNTILGNYLSLFFALVAFSLVARGTQKLLKRAGIQLMPKEFQGILLAFIILGVTYCYLVFRNIDLHSLTSSYNGYYLPIWLAIVSVIIPYLYTWFIGLLAAYDLHRLATNTKGVLYRQSFRFLAYGYALVIASSIGIQYLRTLLTQRGHLSLNSTLAIVYIIYLLIGVGYALISMGAFRLKKIEDA